MSLAEPQILHYSRQILLPGVGGAGQERLMTSGFRLSGKSGAVATAGAYLAAGGTPVWTSGGRVEGSQAGFLFSAGNAGESAPPAWAGAVQALNPDAARSTLHAGQLAETPASFEGDAPWIALGGLSIDAASDAASAVCVLRAADGCGECFARWIAALGPPPEGIQSVRLGSFAALVAQNALLEHPEPSLRAWRLSSDGDLQPYEDTRCDRCR